jgi:hypothetical protein
MQQAPTYRLYQEPLLHLKEHITAMKKGYRREIKAEPPGLV